MTALNLEAQLARVHEWVKTADQKVSIFLAFQGVVLTLVLQSASAWIVDARESLTTPKVLLLVAAIALIGYSLYKSASAIVPRLARGQKPRSLTYFGDIAEFDLPTYTAKVKALDKDAHDAELLEQIHISAIIARKKHCEFRDALRLFFAGLILLVAAVVWVQATK